LTHTVRGPRRVPCGLKSRGLRVEDQLFRGLERRAAAPIRGCPQPVVSARAYRSPFAAVSGRSLLSWEDHGGIAPEGQAGGPGDLGQVPEGGSGNLGQVPRGLAQVPGGRAAAPTAGS
jgi:hypothetical protein